MYSESVERLSSSYLLPLSALWVSAWAAASVVHRRNKGKPILFLSVPGATFIETGASGYSNRTWYTRLGRANRCLVVAIAEGCLIIRPRFPFNLLFLPEIYGLEYEVPVSHIVRIEHSRSDCVDIQFQDGQATQDVTLMLRKPEEFIEALRPT